MCTSIAATFESRMPVITGHETSGIVVQMGEQVAGFPVGDKVTADNSELCGHCHFCRECKLLYCENFTAHGLHCKSGPEIFPDDQRNH